MKYYINWISGFIFVSVNWEPRVFFLFFFLRGSFVPTILFFFFLSTAWKKKNTPSLPFSYHGLPCSLSCSGAEACYDRLMGWSRGTPWTSHQSVVERQPAIHGNSSAILPINLADGALDRGRETEHQGEKPCRTWKIHTGRTPCWGAHGAKHCATTLHLKRTQFIE